MRFERRSEGRGFGGGGRRFGGGGRRFESSDAPKPVKVGEEYDVEISEVGSRGDGIARVNNFVVFVNGAKQGEKSRIKITEVRDRFAIADRAGAEAAPAEGEGASESSMENIGEDGEDENGGSDSEETEEKE